MSEADISKKVSFYRRKILALSPPPLSFFISFRLPFTFLLSPSLLCFFSSLSAKFRFASWQQQLRSDFLRRSKEATRLAFNLCAHLMWSCVSISMLGGITTCYSLLIESMPLNFKSITLNRLSHDTTPHHCNTTLQHDTTSISFIAFSLRWQSNCFHFPSSWRMHRLAKNIIAFSFWQCSATNVAQMKSIVYCNRHGVTGLQENQPCTAFSKNSAKVNDQILLMEVDLDFTVGLLDKFYWWTKDGQSWKGSRTPRLSLFWLQLGKSLLERWKMVSLALSGN